MLEFRLLKANEIECRIARCDSWGVQLLLYKDARCDMNILDETVGSLNWQRHHNRDNANCIVSIWDESKQQWIEKEDTGTESFTEKEKSIASDSFKRACVNVGIGRELYTSPAIFVSPNQLATLRQEGTKWKCNDFFEVADIQYLDRTISYVKIYNTKTRQYIEYGTPVEPKQTQEADFRRKIQVLENRCKASNIDINKLIYAYQINSLYELNEVQYNNIVNHWELIKSKYQLNF